MPQIVKPGAIGASGVNRIICAGSFQILNVAGQISIQNLTGEGYEVSRTGVGTYSVALNDSYFGVDSILLTPSYSFSSAFDELTYTLAISSFFTEPGNFNFTLLIYRLQSSTAPTLVDPPAIAVNFMLTAVNTGIGG